MDGKSIEAIVKGGEEGAMITRLHEALRGKTYGFQPVRRVDIPKPKGGTRPLGIATVEDRVVQTAMKLVVSPIFEADFHDCLLWVSTEEECQDGLGGHPRRPLPACLGCGGD